jgi:hypothetical protein
MKKKKSQIRKNISKLRSEIRSNIANRKPGQFFVRRTHYGLGYEVSDDGMYHTWFYTPDENQAKEVVKILAQSSNPFNCTLPKVTGEWQPKIVIFKGKHGDFYFLVKNITELRNLALRIFMERKREKFWYTFNNCENPEETKVSSKILSKLPKYLQETVKKKTDEFDEMIRWYDEERKQEKFYNEIIENRDGKLALRFLEMRKGYEYEGFSVEEPML